MADGKNRGAGDAGPPEFIKAGILYVVATPIGNLEDITWRAVRILREVSCVASEDTRHTRKLLSHLDIRTELVSYYKGKEASRGALLLEKLQAGQDIALVSDAGTPAVSDPGAILVRMVREAGIRIIPVPGPSALTAAVSVAGFITGPFTFYGFLPAKKSDRRRLLTEAAASSHCLVFYESPRRLCAALADCLAALGDRQTVVARELTKIHEEIVQGSLSEMGRCFAERGEVKGEVVVMVAGAAPENAVAGEDLVEMLVWCRDEAGLSLRDVVRKLTRELGLSRSEVYKDALKVWEENPDA